MKRVLILSISAVMVFAFKGYGFGRGMHSHGMQQHLQISSLPKEELNDAEIEDLMHMREEEKLARDVYLTLYNKWHLKIFNNIAKSEQKHMDAIKRLIEKYSLQDPVKSDSIGSFTNPKMAQLYNQLVAKGSKSVVDALKVGATIEDLDIKDLEDAISRTDNRDISMVYNNLKRGSENHLRAFVRFLRRYGSDYEPQYISYEYFEEIISTPMKRRNKF